MTAPQALDFVKQHGIVLQSARGPVPSLAEAIAGEPIRGSWWAHPKAHQIFQALEAVVESGDVVTCKLIDDRVTYLHRRVWPAIARLAAKIGRARLARVWSEHTPSGAHRPRREPFPRWVPADVLEQAAALSEEDAERQLAPWLALLGKRPRRKR